MRAAFDLWKEVASKTARVPLTSLVAELRSGVNPYSSLIRIRAGEEREFEIIFAGSALEEKLGRALGGEIIRPTEDDSMVAITRAYQRCSKGLVYFDYARVAIRNGKSVLFERVCLPLSKDGLDVDHIFSIVRFSEIDAG